MEGSKPNQFLKPCPKAPGPFLGCPARHQAPGTILRFRTDQHLRSTIHNGGSWTHWLVIELVTRGVSAGPPNPGSLTSLVDKFSPCWVNQGNARSHCQPCFLHRPNKRTSTLGHFIHFWQNWMVQSCIPVASSLIPSE